MRLRLVVGPPAGGKTDLLSREIASKLSIERNRPIIYLTPEQMTLKAELMLMQRMGINSLLGMPVFGFKRLAYAVFEEVGAPKVTWLDDVGKSMILQRVAREHQSELRYFRRSVSQKGFIDRLKMMITEIIQYELDADQIDRMAEEQPQDSILFAKLKDIALLSRAFDEYTGNSGGNLKPSERLLNELIPVIGKSSLIRGADIYIDGFTGFTPQQYHIIEEMLKAADSVTVALTVSEKAWRAADDVRDWRELGPGVFFTAQKTFAKLSEISARLRAQREILPVDRSDEFRKGALGHAVKYLTEIECPVYQPVKTDEDPFPVRVFRESTIRGEVRRCFREILHLVREEGYAYRDIALVVPELSSYAFDMQRTARLYDIPLFIDDKADVRLTPLVMWLESLCAMVGTGYSNQAFISFLKTGLTGFPRETVDILENRALSENWIGKERIIAGLREFDEEQAAVLAEFDEKITRAENAEAYTEAIWEMAGKQGVEASLKQLSEQLREEGNILTALQYERLYEQIRSMLDQLCSILGKLKVSFDEYTAMLKIGVGECRLGQLPATLDEVAVGDLARSKIEGCRAIFFLGFQGEGFPAIHAGASLLSDAERIKLGRQKEIAQGSREDLMEQYYLLKLAMGKASERLYFLSHKEDNKAEDENKSALIDKLEKMFGREALYPKEEQEEVTLTAPLFYEEPARAGWLAGQMGDDLPEAAELLDKLRQGAELRDGEKRLSSELAAKMMDPTRRTLSISQLERYSRCPYQYYLENILKLQERDIPEVTALEDGSLLHELLCEAGELLGETLTDEEIGLKTEEIARGLEENYRVYQTTGRYRYLWNKLQKKAAYCLKILTRQTEYSDFSERDFEWEFGKGRGIEPVTVKLKDGTSVKLEGIIDRVDRWESESGTYVQIIDYKSGNVTFSKDEVYGGYQLQLPVYLEAGMKHFNAKPAGFFYFHLNPEEIEEGKMGKGSLEELQMDKSRLSGVVIADSDVFVHMDYEAAGSKGKVIKAGVNKEGKLSKSSGNEYATMDQFELLIDLVHKRIADSAMNIKEGVITRDPLTRTDSSCKWCDFRMTCPYDKAIPGSRSRTMEKVKKEEFWQKAEELIN